MAILNSVTGNIDVTAQQLSGSVFFTHIISGSVGNINISGQSGSVLTWKGLNSIPGNIDVFSVNSGGVVVETISQKLGRSFVGRSRNMRYRF